MRDGRATLFVTSRSLYSTGRTLHAVKTALPSAETRGAGFTGIFLVADRGDALELAQWLTRTCSEQVGRVMAVLACVPSTARSIREAAVTVGMEQIDEGQTFRFRLRKRGAHSLEQDTPVLEGEIGGAIWVALERKYGAKPRVNLKNADVTIAAEVLGPTTLVGIVKPAWRLPENVMSAAS